jgi:hypothetical protein
VHSAKKIDMSKHRQILDISKGILSLGVARYDDDCGFTGQRNLSIISREQDQLSIASFSA